MRWNDDDYDDDDGDDDDDDDGSDDDDDNDDDGNVEEDVDGRSDGTRFQDSHDRDLEMKRENIQKDKRVKDVEEEKKKEKKIRETLKKKRKKERIKYKVFKLSACQNAEIFHEIIGTVQTCWIPTCGSQIYSKLGLFNGHLPSKRWALRLKLVKKMVLPHWTQWGFDTFVPYQIISVITLDILVLCVFYIGFTLLGCMAFLLSLAVQLA